MSKHTPGPWFVSGVRFKMNGGEWHSINRYNEELKRDENIACVGYDPRTGDGLADARLIAAAPELLDALKLAVATWEKFYPILPVDQAVEDAEFDQMNIARTAICKAVGLQPWDYHQHVANAEGRP